MDYAQEIKNLLTPLKIYDLDSGAGAAEIQVVGGRLDEIFDALSVAEREACLITAENAGLDAYEAIMPYATGGSTAERRAALAALLRIDGCSFTASALNGTLTGCGIVAAVEETGSAETVRVSFPHCRGIPDGIDTLKKRIEDILPCHLEVVYFYAFITWDELEALFGFWRELEAEECWDTLQKLGGGE